ncbi:MAG: hypothetical protein PVJ52_00950 [Candidatus Woesebacteria bacterium]|jgi:hypothetical protein
MSKAETHNIPQQNKDRPDFVPDPTPEWVMDQVGHERVVKRIEKLMRESGSELPQHYKIYRELTLNNGSLPVDYQETYKHLTSQRVRSIEGMVPDICYTVSDLEEKGYMVIDDPKRQVTDDLTRSLVARQMSGIIRSTYPDPNTPNKTIYPLKERDHDKTKKQLESGNQHAWIVYDEEGMPVATFGNINKGNVVGDIYLTELGRSGVNAFYLKKLKAEGISLRGVSQLRTLKLLLDPPYAQINGSEPVRAFFSDLRTSAVERKVNYDSETTVPNGRAVQGTFFGGIKHGVDLGYGVWGTGAQYSIGDKREKTGGMEPFLRIGQWFDPEQAQVELNSYTLLVPNEKVRDMIGSFLGSNMDKVPDIEVIQYNNRSNMQQAEGDPEVILTFNGKSVFSSVDIIDTQQEIRDKVKGLVDEESLMPMSEAISLCVENDSPYMEFYVESTIPKDTKSEEEREKTASVMHKLVSSGAIVTGYTPSDKGNGGIRLTYSLILPEGFKKGLLPTDYPDEYYKNNRLEEAINHVKDNMAELITHSLRSPVNQGIKPEDKADALQLADYYRNQTGS